ncbi:Baculoviral IAP repeat-containing protein 7-B [Liparis tanakae]|uniref:RING-type E3 ubiquitin transferase n=1 Tax=Liparis tanakae TaxID=230148 RepID=A0A4Z2EZD8_9TELE|nr:Baculoviral IAP repeat-containing protein 7-B [Liparis tanakae]
MRAEAERLQTFDGWPADAPVTPGQLAEAGFFFLGPGDKVQCFCCSGVLWCWVRGDDPAAEHARHFPACGHALQGRRGAAAAGGGAPPDSVDGQVLSQLQRMTMDDRGAAGQAVYPEMEAEGSRISTFHNWPSEASVQPDVLARAGFFYTGHGDNVKCFHCDGGLRNWEPGDDPWQEHAKWFPRCEFLIQERGQDYISDIQDSHFHLGDTVGGSQSSTGRDVVSGNDPELRPSSSAATVRAPIRGKAKEPSPEELLRQLQEERTCKVCMDKLVAIVFIPCGHLVVCGDCAASLRHCPICRAVIRGSVRAFMS